MGCSDLPGSTFARTSPEKNSSQTSQKCSNSPDESGTGFGRRLMNLVVVFLSAVGAFGQTNFGSQAVGIASSQTVTVTATGAGSVATVQVLTLGSPNLDYAAGTGTCAGANLAINQQCTLTVSFTPAFPGPRFGAVVLLDGSNNVLGTAYLQGTGSGGLAVLIPGNEVLYAGNGAFDLVDDGQPAVQAQLNLPSSVALDGAGNLYIADSAHDRIRKVDATTHIISTVAGNGNTGVPADGTPALQASLNMPSGVAIDGAGNLYIADTKNNAVRVVSAVTGVISTIAGNGAVGYTGDGGPAKNATLNQPWGVTVNAAGDLYIADTNNHVIRKVTISTGIITTVAGNGATTSTGVGSYSGDGGPAINASLNFPYAVAFDAAGDMLIPDSANNRVRKVDSAGNISTVAGTGANGYSGDGGAASQAQLWSPEGLAVDPAGNIYIADSQNNAIRKINAATGKINTTIATALGESVINNQLVGNSLDRPIGLALDGLGNLYVADYYYLRVRQIQPNVLAVDFTQTPVRQGTISSPKAQSLENDGNNTLSVTSLTPDANSALDAASTTCLPGTLLAPDAACILGVEFAPSVAGNPLVANLAITAQSGDSPLNVVVVGNAPAVNSTTTTLTATPSPSSFGQTVTLTATVITGQNTGALTGTVTFYDGTTKLQSPVTVNGSGKATISLSNLTVGSHSLWAAYSGETLHFASDNSKTPFVQVVNEGTSTTVTSSANPSAVGSPVTFKATVSIGANGGGVTPDGTVTFMDGNTALATVPLTGGSTATYTTSTLIDGAHSITATFSGDPATYILGSASGVLSQDVLAPSTVAVSSGVNPSVYGSPVTFTATVTSTASVAPSGTVNFLDGNTQIGSATISGTSGIATFTTTHLSAGTHPIEAVYKGNPNSGPGTSPAIVQTVNLTQTTTALACTPAPAIAGAAVNLTARVSVITGSATATGSVTFTDGTTKLGTTTVSSGGTASITPMLAPGAHAIVASYAGDGNDNPSTSNAMPVNVVLATTAVALNSSGSPAQVLSSVTFTASVTGNGGMPSGSVIFSVDGVDANTVSVDAHGNASFADSGLLVGNHAVSARYSGDSNDNPSMAPTLPIVIQPISTVTNLGSSASSGANPQAILVATALSSTGPTPTGAVNFTDSKTNKLIGSAALDASGVATIMPDLPAGTYSVVASYSGDSLHSASTSSPVTFSGAAVGFTVAATPPSLTLVSSQNGTITMNVSSANGFADTIGMGCLSLPAGVNCHFSNATVKLAAGQTAAVQVTIDTNAPLSGGQSARNSKPGARNAGSGLTLASLCWPAAMLLGIGVWRFRRRNPALVALAIVLFLSGSFGLTGCGASFSQNTVAPGTYTIQVGGVGTGSNISHYTNVTLTVTK